MVKHSTADDGFLPRKSNLTKIYRRMLRAYGPQHWWPGDSPFEVMVGAILTQNTAWSNVERAIANLKQARMLSAKAIATASPEQVAELIRPAGYFNVKARRLQHFCVFLQEQGGERALRRMETQELRHALLAVHGVGAETADDMLLYAFDRPVFVIDAYTRRIFTRLGLAQGGETYEALRRGFEKALGHDVAVFNEYHALIVRHAKAACAKKPRCAGCCLADVCLKRC